MLILPLFALFQSAAASFGAASHAPPLESVYAVQQEADGLAVRVRSNGCTSAASFAVTIAKAGDQSEITLQRSRPDNCRAFLRDGVVVKWTWAQLGIAAPVRLILVNPLAER